MINIFALTHYMIAKDVLQPLQTGRLLVVESAHLDGEVCNPHDKGRA